MRRADYGSIMPCIILKVGESVAASGVETLLSESDTESSCWCLLEVAEGRIGGLREVYFLADILDSLLPGSMGD